MKKQIAEVREKGVDFPPHLGYILKGMGEALIDDFQDHHGMELDKEARDARGGEPLASVGEAEIKVEISSGNPKEKPLPATAVPSGIVTATMPLEIVSGRLTISTISPKSSLDALKLSF